MKILTPQNKSDEYLSSRYTRCFLAGGITGCKDWQKQTIDSLLKYESNGFSLDNLVILNPRCANFDVNNEMASVNQIHWEYDYLTTCDILSVYFSSETIQPIVLYELGKYGEMLRRSHNMDIINDYIIVSVEKEYERSMDIKCQMRYAFDGKLKINFNADPYEHATRILEAYLRVDARKITER